jgi:tetratricopeptide (TPR) repeat protein
MTALGRLVVCFTVVAGTAAPAHAGPKEDAARHTERAMKAHADGKFETALRELLIANKLDPRPELLYAIGQVYAKLEDCKEAIVYYERFLETKPDPEAASEVRGGIAACKAKLPPEPAPEPTPEPKPEPTPAPAPTPPPTKTAQATPPPDDNPLPPRQTDAPPRWYKDKIGGVLVIGGVALGVVGGIVYRSALSDLDAAESSSTLERYDELVDSARSKRVSAVVLTGAGVAAIGAGVVRYMMKRSSTETSVVVVPHDGGGLVTWSGSF